MKRIAPVQKRSIRLEAKSTVMLEACSYQALNVVPPVSVKLPWFMDKRLPTSSVTDYGVLS
jgi:hypothetical protein